ncbi:hypothetical protein C5167_008830 [Papaver somniferum]|uniref:Uncharacterized protein n=1 Tax=Papaver somniferum TaxID=3469 RepID=A0A4Y7JYS1_PAPSO|nr:hypothetical protein C5167_008830 [Papaver somniferum]
MGKAGMVWRGKVVGMPLAHVTWHALARFGVAKTRVLGQSRMGKATVVWRGKVVGMPLAHVAWHALARMEGWPLIVARLRFGSRMGKADMVWRGKVVGMPLAHVAWHALARFGVAKTRVLGQREGRHGGAKANCADGLAWWGQGKGQGFGMPLAYGAASMVGMPWRGRHGWHGLPLAQWEGRMVGPRTMARMAWHGGAKGLACHWSMVRVAWLACLGTVDVAGMVCHWHSGATGMVGMPWRRDVAGMLCIGTVVSVFEAAVKHGNKFAYLQSWSTNEAVVILVAEVQVLEEDEKVVVVASSGSCVSVESLNIPWVILNLFERSALLNESNEFFRKNVAYALSQGFMVIVGISETLE